MEKMDLPKGHWMHGVAAKEKARLAKKKGGGTTAPTEKAAALQPGASMAVGIPQNTGVAGGLGVKPMR